MKIKSENEKISLSAISGLFHARCLHSCILLLLVDEEIRCEGSRHAAD